MLSSGVHLSARGDMCSLAEAVCITYVGPKVHLFCKLDYCSAEDWLQSYKTVIRPGKQTFITILLKLVNYLVL